MFLPDTIHPHTHGKYFTEIARFGETGIKSTHAREIFILSNNNQNKGRGNVFTVWLVV